MKHAAAKANVELGGLEPSLGDAIAAAAQQVIDGQLDEHFPLVIWQTGSGTQTNMNANEVIANRAIEMLGGVLGSKSPIHPNDHVNLCQSSNDAVPTAMHVAAVEEITGHLVPELNQLTASFATKAAELGDLVKIGRTHLMDATPMRAADEWTTFSKQIEYAGCTIELSIPRLLDLPIGGTAIGTGMNSVEGFDQLGVDNIAEMTGHSFNAASNKFEPIASHDAIVVAHSAIRSAAIALLKIANDIRLLASGPRCGLGELVLPTNEPGSSIMPGKVNPTQCEALAMVCTQVLGNDVTVGVAGAGGYLQLNVYKPLLCFNLLQSVRLLGDAARCVRMHCIDGPEVDRLNMTAHLERSLMFATALAPHIGYDRSAQIAKTAFESRGNLLEAALDAGISKEDFDRWLDIESMLTPRG